MKIIVTDLTRFRNPDIVCLAGINVENGHCVRPMFPNGNKFEYFQFSDVKSHKIIPGSILEGNFSLIGGLSKPHVEDHSTGGGLIMHGPASGADFEEILESSSVETVKAGFGFQPDKRLYSLANPPARSIVTLKLTSPRTQFRLTVDTGYGDPKFKAHVTDGQGYELSWLPVTDLGFSDHLAKIRQSDPNLFKLNAFLQSQKILYVRIGLTRQYAPTPDRDGYWVQVNGIYSFPNYREDLRIYD